MTDKKYGCARYNLHAQKFNPFFYVELSEKPLLSKTRCFFFYVLSIAFRYFFHVSFYLYSIFQQTHHLKKDGFSTSSNLHSFCMNFTPIGGIAQKDALVNRRVNFYPHLFSFAHMQVNIIFCLHPTFISKRLICAPPNTFCACTYVVLG